MKTYRLPFLLAVLLLGTFIFGCTSRAVRLVSYTPKNEVPGQTSFTFEFNKDLAPADSLDKWSSTPYLEFTPEIPGKFKWTAPNVLVFSPEAPLQPSQDYKAKVNKAVLFDTKLSGSFDQISFHTPYFDVEKADMYWTQVPRSEYRVSVQANIRFKYPVDPAALMQYLEVSRDGAPVQNLEIITKSPAELITVNLGEVQQTDKEQNISLKIKKGLNSVIGKQPLAEDRVFQTKLPAITQLEIQYVTSGYDGDQGWIEVGTSQMVDESSLDKYVHLSSGGNLTYNTNASNFRIYGTFKAASPVTIKIDKGLPGMYGGTLNKEYTAEVQMSSLAPDISFSDKRERYLMLSGFRNLGLNVVNVSEADIEVYQIYKNNLLYFLTHQNYRPYSEDEGGEEEYYYDYDYYDPNEYGKLLYTEKIKTQGRENELKKTVLNLDKAIKGREKGIYLMKILSGQDRWRTDKKFVSISDFGIIAKQSDNDLLVWVNSLDKAEPVSGVTVKLISSNNQTLLEGKTGSDGLVKFTDIKGSTEGFKPRMILAEKGDDFNYIDLQETFIETSRFEVGGKPESSSGYDAFIYGDRNLYRPGEEAHISAIIRDKLMKSVVDVPLIVKMVAPSGKVFQEWKKTTNAEGSFELAFNIPSYAPTGQYRAEIQTGAGLLISSYAFSVEEFAPDKIKLGLQPGNTSLKPGEVLQMKISSRYMFGTPAAKHKYELDVNFTHHPYESKRFANYAFDQYSFENTAIQNYVRDGFLDAEGNADIQYPVPGNLKSGGIIKAMAMTTVFDVTGRTVSRWATFNIYTKNYFAGIKSPGQYLDWQKDNRFSLAVVDEKDNQINGFRAEVELVRYEWHSVLRNSNGRFSYASEKREVSEWKKEYTINGTQDIIVRPAHGGEYELRLRKQGETGYVKSGFYAYGYGSSTASSFQVNKEGNINIAFDKSSYEPGQTAKVLFTTPFSGRMLVTIERDKVYEYKYLEVKNNNAEITLPVTEAYMPNVYISATLFKKHKADQETPFLVGHGWLSMRVEKAENKLDVKIIAPEKIKPLTTQEIIIKTIPRKDVYVTLAAVDEGILQVKGYNTPDPYGYMYATRRLSTNSYDLYRLLLPEIASGKTGGGGDFNMQKKRSMPLSAQRFKLFSYWSGIRKSDATGTVKVSLKVPQFNGEVRLMAVAYTGSRFGSGESSMIVSDDVILMPAVPRFLSQNDQLDLPVSLMNTTDRKGQVTVKMKLQGPMTATSDLSETVTLEPKGEQTINFKLKTGQEVGVGKISFTATGMATTSEEIEIAVRPNSPFVKEDGGGVLSAGQTQKINLPSGYLASSQESFVTVSGFPAIRQAGQLRYLLGYPYGCAEQTVSKAFPQMYFEDIVAAAAPDMIKHSGAVNNVKEGIRKLQNMQLYDGSIAYWPGGNYYNWWSATYAAHFLVEADKAGYEVNRAKLDDLLKFIRNKAATKAEYNYGEWNGSNVTYKKIAQKEIIYSLYVLALAKKGDMALMNYYRARPNLVPGDMQYMLAASYALMGNWNTYNALLPKNFSAEKPVRESGYTFDSDIRANAIILNVLMEVDPNNPQIPQLVTYLVNNTDRALSTQDMAWSFIALGKAARQTAGGNVTVIASAGDGTKLGTYSGKTLRLNGKDLNNKSVTLAATGSGNAYYYWHTEGVKVNQRVKEEDKNISIRRTYYDRFGRRLDENTLRQGQLIVCRIALESFDRKVENVAITDMIPAGLEILNPRLGNTNQMNWIPTARMQPQSLDIRDDRLIIFTSIAARKRQEYYYMMRVINQGTFQLPAIGAEAMYDPSYHSYNGARTITVVKGDPNMM